MPKEDLIFGNLNDRQKQAVQTIKGPVLILAGAGSGKTRALTHRIANLIRGGVPPWQILAVTFTNKAAKEMQQRIVNLLRLTNEQGSGPFDSPFGLTQGNRQPRLPVMGTFHSVCVRILRRDIEHIGRNRNFVIYDTSDQESLMKEVLKEMQIDVKELKAFSALGHISRFKSEALSPKEVAEQATTDFMGRIVKMYALYQSKLRMNNALDFDDLLLETVRLWQEAPKILERYQETWQYINVDEYQDTNHAQYLLISELARKYRNLCVIGDPDQSIYAFRGADIRNIMQFQKEYPDALSIKLEQNYRSTQPILDAADNVIKSNPGRPEKKMWTHRIDGEKICVHEVADEKREAEEAVQSVITLLAQGIPLNEQVVLYRTNAQSRLFEEACLRHALPYRIVGGMKFYARREVKDLLAYLYALHNPNDSLSLLRIINVPSRKIGDTTIQKIQAYCQEHNLSLWEALQITCHAEERRAAPFETPLAELGAPQGDTRRVTKHVLDLPEPTRKRLSDFVSLLENFQQKKLTMNVADLSRALLKDINMEAWLRDDTAEGEARWENIGELLTVMQKYNDLPPDQSFVSFLEEVTLVSEVDKLSEMRTDALTLMTLHLCKGLEFQHVIIAGCEEGIFPHSNALFSRDQLEEERRIMYVGMTRAKDLLDIYFARSRMFWGRTQANAPSRFLDDLPPERIERKSDDLMSPLLWKTSKQPNSVMLSGGPQYASSSPLAHARSAQNDSAGRRRSTKEDLSIEFNQDFGSTSVVSQIEQHTLQKGNRIHHPSFGEGIITAKRGDIVDVSFDSGEKKRFALSIAPLRALEKS